MFIILVLAACVGSESAGTPVVFATEEYPESVSDDSETIWEQARITWEKAVVQASLARGVQNPMSREIEPEEHDWTQVLNLDGIQGDIMFFEFEEQCGVTFGVIEQIGILGDYGFLVRYTPDEPAQYAACPEGTLFQVEVF